MDVAFSLLNRAGRTALVRNVLWRVRRLDFWLKSACILAMLFAALQILMFSHGRDQTIYAAVADGILQGEMPYRDRWDFKPPGIFLIHAASLAVFGQNMWGVRVFEVAGLCILAWCFIGLSRRFFLDTRPGYIGAALTFWIHAQMEFWHSGQPEIFGAVLTALGLWLATFEANAFTKQIGIWLVCGAAFGIAFLMKPPLGGGAVICGFYLMRARINAGDSRGAALLPLVLVGVGSLLPIIACAVWFMAASAWGDLAWTLFEFTPGYTKLSWGSNAAGGWYYALTSSLVKYSALIAFGVFFAAGFGTPISTRERELTWLLVGVVALHLSGIAMQAKFFQYHFTATLPLLALLAGLGWYKLWRHAVRHGGGGAVAFASLVIMVASARVAVGDVPHGYWDRCAKRMAFLFDPNNDVTWSELNRDLYYVADYNLGANRDVVARLQALSKPGDSLYVWGFEPSLYWLSQLQPASRYIYNVPQRAPWEQEHARTTLLADLNEHPPQLIVVQHNDFFRFVTGDDLDSKRALATLPELRTRLETEYVFTERVEDFEIYLRRPKG